MAHKNRNLFLLGALCASMSLASPLTHTSAQSAPRPDALIAVGIAGQTSAPLHVVRVQMGDDMLTGVTVENRSSKDIASYQLGWSITVPPDSSTTPHEPDVTLGPLDRAQIAPGAKSTAHNYRLWISELENLAAGHNAKELDIQVGVIGVTFADGSHWNFDLASNKIFEPLSCPPPNRRCPVAAPR